MQTAVQPPALLSVAPPGSFKGSRADGLVLRAKLVDALQRGQEVYLDFTGVEATQGFVDELVGVLVLQAGPSVMKRLAFKGCSMGMRAIINFVVADRAAQHKETMPV